MARNMSFTLTTQQVQDRSKTVTRRLGWKSLQAGTLINACRKCMGLKKGEKVERLALIRITGTRWEPLNDITPDDVIKEGFPEWTPQQFIDLFCKANKCKPDALVNRIEFEYVDDVPKCRCGAEDGALGAWDIQGYWRSEDSIHSMNSTDGMYAFGGDFPTMKRVSLNSDGLCQRCRPKPVKTTLKTRKVSGTNFVKVPLFEQI